jgi:hypothetical protein
MKLMKKLGLGALALLAGCSGGATSREEEVPENLRKVTRVVPTVPDRWPYGDVTKAKVGQWVRYRDGGATFTLAAVGREGDDLWVEKIDEGEARQASARRVGPDGVVKKAFYRDFTKDGASEVVPQTLEQEGVPRVGPPEGTRATGEEKVQVGGRELVCRLVRTRSEDLEGRLREVTTLWHPDVPPLYAGTADGGLVRRRSGSSVVELEGFGTDAKPLVPIPNASPAKGSDPR